MRICDFYDFYKNLYIKNLPIKKNLITANCFCFTNIFKVQLLMNTELNFQGFLMSKNNLIHIDPKDN